jgi:hypothetical protein
MNPKSMKKTIKNSIFLISFSVLPAAAITFLPNPSYGAVISASLDPDLFGNLDQAKTNCPNFSCGPTAATNSFAYLQRRFPQVYGSSLIPDTNNNGMIDEAELIAVANNVGANFMKSCVNNCGTGTYIEDFIIGKRDYIESKVPGKTKYGAQIALKWRVNADDFPAGNPGSHLGTPKPDFVQDMRAATLAFLAGEIARGEDVEVFVAWGTNNAHYLTLTGISYNDQTNMGTLNFIDPAGGLPGMANILGLNANGVIQTSYAGGSSLFHAVSESTPEASTVLGLLALGLLGGGVQIKQRYQSRKIRR